MTMRRAVLASLILMLVVAAAGPVLAYDNDTHYCLTYFLARQIGYTPKQAHQIASGAVAVDLSPATEPLQVPKTLANDPIASEIRANFHAFADSAVYDRVEKARLANGDSEAAAAMKATEAARATRDARQNALWQQGLQSGNCGVYLHFFQDIYCHGQYWSYLGHPFKGHLPDFMSYDVESARSMVWDVITELSSFMHLRLAREPAKLDSYKVDTLFHRLLAVNRPDTADMMIDFATSPLEGGVPNWRVARDEVSKALGETVPDWIEYPVTAAGTVSSDQWRVEGYKPLTAPLRIKVVEADTGLPITGAKVTMRFQSKQEVQRAGVTKDGIFDVASVPGDTGRFVAKAVKQGYRAGLASFEVGTAGPYVVTIHLKSGKGVAGTWRLDTTRSQLGRSEQGPVMSHPLEGTPEKLGDYAWTVSGTHSTIDWNVPTRTPHKLHAEWELPAFPEELAPGQILDLTITGSANADAQNAWCAVQFYADGTAPFPIPEPAWLGHQEPKRGGEIGPSSFGMTKTGRWTVPDPSDPEVKRVHVLASVAVRGGLYEQDWVRPVYDRFYVLDDDTKPTPVSNPKLTKAPSTCSPDPATASVESRRKMTTRSTPPSKPSGYQIVEARSGALVSIDGAEATELKAGTDLPKGKTLDFMNQGIYNLSIKLPSGAVVILVPTTVFRIEPDGGLLLLKGAVDVEGAPGAPKSSVEIRTPDATVTDDGTVFRVSYDPDAKRTTVGVTEGAVKVTPKTSGHTPVSLQAGQQVTCTNGHSGAVTKITAPPSEAKPETRGQEGAAHAEQLPVTAGGKWCGPVIWIGQGAAEGWVVLTWPGFEVEEVAEGGVTALRVRALMQGEPAEGKLKVGDLLTRVNGAEVKTLKQLFDLVATVVNGDTPAPIVFEVRRGREALSAGFVPAR
jgi:hypothetical protein